MVNHVFRFSVRHINIKLCTPIMIQPGSTQLSMKIYLLINSKLLISTVVFLLNLDECEIFYAYNSWHFHIYQQRKFHAQLS